MKNFPLVSMCSIYPEDKRMPCPCFISKNINIIDVMKKLKISYLMWSCLGAGAISIYDLEEEKSGKRKWDIKEGLTDIEFIKECRKNNIHPFGVIFTGQAHKIGITLNKNEDKILKFGKSFKKRTSTWGIEEFYQNRYPKIFKGWRDYFKDGLKDKNRKPIKNFVEECACRNILNEVCKANWVLEHPKYFDHKAYLMCKNSPHWKKYLKKQIEILIDADVSGILFDEIAAPFEWIIASAGFCKYCRESFRKFLIERYGNKFKNFDYRKYLTKSGFYRLSGIINFNNIPYSEDFKIWQLKVIKENFAELVNFTKEYSNKRNKSTLITSNFVDMLPFYFHLIDLVDIVNLEVFLKFPPDTNAPVYKLARTLAKDKPVSCVPTIMNAANFRRRSKNNLMKNLEKYFIAEAVSNQVVYEIPYSCFSLEGEGPYYPKVENFENYQNFIFEHIDFYKGLPVYDISVIFSFPSYLWTLNWISYPGSHFLSYSGALSLLSSANILFNVIVFGDSENVSEFYNNNFSKILILPNVEYLTDNQVEFLKSFSERNKILVAGNLNKYNERNRMRDKIEMNFKNKNIIYFDYDIFREYRWEGRDFLYDEFVKKIKELEFQPSISTNLQKKVIINIYKSEDRIFLHLLNNCYKEEKDVFIPVNDLEIKIRKEIAECIKSATFYSPDFNNTIECEISDDGKDYLLKIPELLIYGVVVLQRDED